MKNIWTGCVLSGLAIVVVCFCLVGGVFKWILGKGVGVVDQVTEPRAIIANYEWFEQQVKDIKAAEGQIHDAENSLSRFKEDNGPTTNWKFDQRGEYSRLSSNLTGLQSYRRGLIETYNARASMISRNLWKSSVLPQHIDQ